MSAKKLIITTALAAIISVPGLAIGGDKSLGEFLGRQMKLAASDVTAVVVDGSGHWLLEEQPDQTTRALVGFL